MQQLIVRLARENPRWGYPRIQGELLRLGVTQVLDAHGGLENWSKVKTLTGRLSLGGSFWKLRGWPGIYDGQTIELDPHREHIVFTPFTAPDRSSVLDVEPERVAIQTAGGVLVEQRSDPRSSYPIPFEQTTPWDALQIAYFTSYAVWNYLTTPFLFTTSASRPTRSARGRRTAKPGAGSR